MPSNQGAAARNAGIAAASCKSLIMLDDDAFIEPPHIQALLHGLETTPLAGSFSFPVRNATEAEGCLLPTIFHGCACGFRKSSLLDAGGYPTDYLYYGEEYEVAFRLYAKGYSSLRSSGGIPVRHERDPGGRNKSRIIKLLIQNNLCWIWTHFSPRLIFGATQDILQRYRCVARKEHVQLGYHHGNQFIPLAILRGLLHRKQMSKELLHKALLLSPLAHASRQLNNAGMTRVILCGTGKFPTLWLNQLRQHHVKLEAILELNPCWTGQKIAGIPVITDPAEITKRLKTDVPALAGISSFPENERWYELLKSHTYFPVSTPHKAELSSPNGNFNLLDGCNISIWAPKTAL
jgi:hypothetical protein